MKLYIPSSRLWKILKYTLLFLFLILAETVLLPRLMPSATLPDLLLAAIVAVGMAEDERTAGICGLCAGFFADAAGTFGVSVLPLCYMLCGYVCGVLARFVLRRNFLSYIVYMLVAAMCRAMLTLIMLQFTQSDCPITSAFSDIVLPEYAVTLLASPLVYFAVALPLAAENRQRLRN